MIERRTVFSSGSRLARGADALRGSRSIRVLGLLALATAFSLPVHAGGRDAPEPQRRGKKQRNSNAGKPTEQIPGAAASRRPGPTAAGIATPGAVRTDREADISIGTPIQFHNISVLPVVTRRKGPFQSYTLFEQGLAAKTFDVRELDGSSGQAQVNHVEVRNRGAEPVYLLGGEMILGGKQDRIIAGDTVVAPDEKWTKVAVFCVEQGRWRGQNMQFQSGKAMADVSIIRAAMSGSQSEVWNEVSKKNVIHGTQNATQTYRRTIQNAAVRKKIAPYVRQLQARLPADEQLAGLVFGINGKIHVADIFGNPVLFGDLQGKLLTAYVLEALGHQVVRDARPVSTKAAKQFIGKGRSAKHKGVKKSGRARSISKDEADFIGAETIDTKTGEKVRETYIGK